MFSVVQVVFITKGGARNGPRYNFRRRPLVPVHGMWYHFPVFRSGGSCPFGEAALSPLHPRHPLPREKHLIFDIPAASTAGPVATLVGRARRTRRLPKERDTKLPCARVCANGRRYATAYSSFIGKTANLKGKAKYGGASRGNTRRTFLFMFCQRLLAAPQ